MRRAVTLARQAKAKSLKHEVFAKQHFDVLINTTPCGMKGVKQALPIAENELNAGLVFDMVYNPLETPLLALARSRGIPVVSGLKCLCSRAPGSLRYGPANPRRKRR